MKNVLVVTASINGKSGNSSKLTQLFVDKLSKSVDINIDTLDLASEQLGHLTQDEMQAWGTAEQERTSEQVKLASVSDNYIAQIKQADYVVMGLPMYNFDSPSVVKAYFDRLARAGVTFAYTENGPVGKLTNKKVFALFARGGKYQGTAMDTQTSYIKNFFGFLGMQNVDFAYAEGLAMGPDSLALAFDEFDKQTSTLIANLAD